MSPTNSVHVNRHAPAGDPQCLLLVGQSQGVGDLLARIQSPQPGRVLCEYAQQGLDEARETGAFRRRCHGTPDATKKHE